MVYMVWMIIKNYSKVLILFEEILRMYVFLVEILLYVKKIKYINYL